ncbi:WASF3 [Branchiostoma lanceolatum]|uniref:WASF3 protein n=1 Tax=Branchiostoma lanceolatum TaxID=7740 RepID=A0A8J9VXV4_BRALA|nr:WASF3 [Branchiostoma lanceolatum]
MPFPKRSVKPEALGERPGSGPGTQVGPPAVWDDLDAVTNSMLAGTLRQLADLLKNATDIFDDLDSELHRVACRSEKLLTRIENVEDKVKGLDARSVPIRLVETT